MSPYCWKQSCLSWRWEFLAFLLNQLRLRYCFRITLKTSDVLWKDEALQRKNGRCSKQLLPFHTSQFWGFTRFQHAEGVFKGLLKLFINWCCIFLRDSVFWLLSPKVFHNMVHLKFMALTIGILGDSELGRLEPRPRYCCGRHRSYGRSFQTNELTHHRNLKGKQPPPRPWFKTPS